MKKTVKILPLMLSVIFILSCFAACNKDSKKKMSGLWDSATYKEDTALGEGNKEIKVDVTAGDKTVTFTVKTEAETLGGALFSLGLINDPSFFNVVNGIEASWEKDKAYWGFYQGEEYMLVGVNDAKISGGESYRLVYQK